MAPDDDAQFLACVSIILDWEGGYVDNPNDSGGATNRGITEATLEDWHRSQGLPLPVTKDDVYTLSVDTAQAIYRARYWTPGLPPGVDLLVFDVAVMSGLSTGEKFLQRALGNVLVDGVAGPATKAAAQAADARKLIASISGQRVAFYGAIATRQPKDAIFLNGWLRRVSGNEAKALAMAG